MEKDLPNEYPNKEEYEKSIYRYFQKKYGLTDKDRLKKVKLPNSLTKRLDALVAERFYYTRTTFTSSFNLTCLHLPGNGTSSIIQDWIKTNDFNVIRLGNVFLDNELKDDQLASQAEIIIRYINKFIVNKFKKNVILFDEMLYKDNYDIYKKLQPYLEKLSNKELMDKIVMVIGVFYPCYWQTNSLAHYYYGSCDEDMLWPTKYGGEVFKFEPDIKIGYRYIKYKLKEYIRIDEKRKLTLIEQKELESYKYYLELIKYMEKNSKLKICDFNHYFDNNSAIPYVNIRMLSHIFLNIGYEEKTLNISFINKLIENLDYTNITDVTKEEILNVAKEFDRNKHNN